MAEGAAGKLELLSLRLYDPGKRQWNLHSASVGGGALAPPMIGGFRDGRGEFHSEETLDGRPIRARFVISQVAPDAWRFEQAFSPDGGESCELNWIAIDTRADGSAAAALAPSRADEAELQPAADRPNGARNSAATK